MIVIHPRFPEYEIHSDGRVFRIKQSKRHNKPGDEIKGRVLKSGYRQFKLNNASGEQVLIRANRLVCEAFRGSAPSPNHHAAHNNGVRLDNRVENLRWDTPKGNNSDRYTHGTVARGEDSPRSKLSDEQVEQIRVELRGSLKRGTKRRELAQKFGVGLSTIGRVAREERLVSFSALDRRA